MAVSFTFGSLRRADSVPSAARRLHTRSVPRLPALIPQPGTAPPERDGRLQLVATQASRVGVFAAAAPVAAPRPSTSSSGDPVKRKRPREQPALPIPSAPPAAAALAAPFATGPPESSPATFPTSLPSLDAAGSDPQDPRSAALLNQLLASFACDGTGGRPGLGSAAVFPLDSPQLLSSLQTLAGYYGIPLPGQPPAASSSAGPAFPAAAHQQAAPAPSGPASTAASASGTTSRRRSAKDREHFAAIDVNTLAAPPVGKQNPRDPSGCSNCKRKKSTTWREGTGSDGKLMSVCNGAYRAVRLFLAKPALTNNFLHTLQPAASTSTRTATTARRPARTVLRLRPLRLSSTRARLPPLAAVRSRAVSPRHARPTCNARSGSTKPVSPSSRASSRRSRPPSTSDRARPRSSSTLAAAIAASAAARASS